MSTGPQSTPPNSGLVGDPQHKGEDLPLWAHCRAPHSLGEEGNTLLAQPGTAGSGPPWTQRRAPHGGRGGWRTAGLHADVEARGVAHGALGAEAAFHQAGGVLRGGAGGRRPSEAPAIPRGRGQRARGREGRLPARPSGTPARRTWTGKWALVGGHRPGTPCETGTSQLQKAGTRGPLRTAARSFLSWPPHTSEVAKGPVL